MSGGATDSSSGCSAPSLPGSLSVKLLTNPSIEAQALAVRWLPRASGDISYYHIWLRVDDSDDWLLCRRHPTAPCYFTGPDPYPEVLELACINPSTHWCVVADIHSGRSYWVALAAKGPGGWSEYVYSDSIATPFKRPVILAPLPEPSRKRKMSTICDDHVKLCKALPSSSVQCSWPECDHTLTERRLDSDMEAYSHEEFVKRYAPATGVTVRWDRAPAAAQYCKTHIAKRASLLQRFGCDADHSDTMANAGWIHLHPETDSTTLAAFDQWLADSKELYRRVHPLDRIPDERLVITKVWCFSNKNTAFVSARGNSSSNRWTYDPLNLAGQLASNRRLLVHGMSFSSISSILDQDLKMSGLELEAWNGGMLGNGVYVADSFLKSLRYADYTWQKYDGASRATKYVFLVEVNMGKPLVCTGTRRRVGWKPILTYEGSPDDVTRSDISCARGKAFFLSTMALSSGWARGCRIPCRPSTEPSASPSYFQDRALLFNEWCIHNTQRFRIRYLVRLQDIACA